MRHGEMLAPGIEHVLDVCRGARPPTSPAIAVGVGPGPFTGLRVGLVTARTLALVREVPVHGVCSLDILAAEAIDAGLDGVRGGHGCAPQGGLPGVVRRGAAGLRPRGDQAGGRGDRRAGRGPGRRALPGALPATRPDPSTPRPRCSATSYSASASRSSTPTRSTCAAPTPPSPGSRSGSAEDSLQKNGLRRSGLRRSGLRRSGLRRSGPEDRASEDRSEMAPPPGPVRGRRDQLAVRE